MRNSKKKGSGNVEMVISFVFFVGFVLTLFLFLKPENTTTLSGAVIFGLYDSFEDETHTNLSILFLKSNYAGESTDCFYINIPQGVFEYPIDNGNIHVASLDGNTVESNIVSQNLNIKNEGKFFRIAISPEFEDGSLSSCNLLENYQIGGIMEKKVVSYNFIKEMRDEYYSDYNSLRTKLGVPPIYDFVIIIEDMSELNMIPELGIPSSVDVMARDYVFEILKSDGTFNNQRVNFRIW